MFGRKKVAALLAEFLGTGVLTLAILNIQRSQIGLQYFVALGAGMAVLLLTFVFVEYSGAFFNPAIAVALWTARKLSSVAAVAYIVAEFLGALLAMYTYMVFTHTHSLTNIGGHFTWRILLAEAVGTFVFTLIYSSTLKRGVSQLNRSVVAGLGYALGVLIASSAALGLLNPAVALGIKSWVWGTYVLGPVVGAVVGINLYSWLFAEPAKATASASVAARSTSAKKKTASKRK